MSKTQSYYYGDSGINNIEYLLKKDHPKNIFLVTDKNSFALCGAKNIFSKILNIFSFTQFSEFEENPKIEDVEKGIKLFRDNFCDYVIAIGGGSVIDMAKLINIGQAHEKSLRDIILNPAIIKNPCKKLIAIPTTSGTGSEATHFAVIYIGGGKYSLAHEEYILPDIVVLIPSLTYTLSAIQTAISGLDALSHGIESYWSVNSTVESKKYAKKAIKLIWRFLPEAVNNRESHEARKQILRAANLAGKAINISKTTGAHAISYTFTSNFRIPHGHAVALTLGEWFAFNCNANQQNVIDKRGVEYVKRTMNELLKLIKAENSEMAVINIHEFIEKVGIITKLSQLKIKINDLDLIINNVNLERMNNNPCRISKEEIKEMLFKIF